jgi:hypothetical protein
MVVFHTAGRRPTADVRSSAAAAPRPARGNAAPDVADARAARPGDGSTSSFRNADFDALLDRALTAIRAAGDRPDPVFGPFAELNSIVRAVTYHEGRLLEWGVARLADENPSLVRMPPETALPIVPTAVELQRNEWAGLEGLRLRSEVHYSTTYTPDLFLVDRERHSALILDVKRSLASYAERRLNMLRRRMMAAALIAGDWLHIEGRVAGVSRVDIAIIDGSSERHDRASGIFALDAIGDLIGIADAGAVMRELRANFARRVQAEVEASCRRAFCRDNGDDADALTAGATEDDDGDDSVDGAAGPDDGKPLDEDEDDAVATDRRQAARRRVTSEMSTGRRPAARQPIRVGFARGSGP